MIKVKTQTAANALLLLAYLFFCFLMLEIVLQYRAGGTETAFLNIKQDYMGIPLYLPMFYIHVFTAILALPAGATQFSKWIMKKYPQVHRINGRVYVMGIVVLGAPSGFYIGLFANGGIASQLSFCLLAVLWIWFTWKAFVMARQRNFKAHKAFMYRSFALTLSAITLRAWKYILVGFFHPRPMDVYQLIAWLGWVPNLLIAEYLINKKLYK